MTGTESSFGTLNQDRAYPYMDATTALRTHEKLIRYQANKYTTSGVSFDDLAQEGRIALLSALETFEGKNDAALWTYAYPAVKGAMLRFLATELGEASRPAGLVGEDDEALAGLELEEPNAEEAMVGREDEARDRETLSAALFALRALVAREQQIVRLHLEQGESFRAIAKLLNISKTEADRAYRVALASLKAAA